MKKKGELILVPVLALLMAITAYFFLNRPPAVQAACGSGPYLALTPITAYAMGNQYSYPGYMHEVVIGDAAAIAGRYPWGTCIRLPYNSVTIKTYNGGSVTLGTFYIWDTGSGTGNRNWVDIYFGRYKRYGQECNCPYVPNPGYCVDNTITNSCDEATIFGTQYWTIQPDSG